MLNRFSQCLVIAAALGLAAPVFARTISQPFDLNQPAKIGSTTLKPGHYEITADLSSNQVRVKRDRDGKLIANVEGSMVTLHRKPEYSAVLMDGRQVTEIQFAGKIEAIKIPNS